MKDISRREVLLGTAAVVAAAAIPSAPITITAPVEVIPAWAVGTPGEFNWQHIVAKTADEAKRIFLSEWTDDSCEGEEGAPCGECETCTLDVEAERKPMWDGLKDTSPGDWLRADMGTYCSRCSYETFPHENGYAVGSEAVCEECMTLADWDIVNPDHAAELRAEIADELT